MDFLSGGIDSSTDPMTELGLPVDQTSAIGLPIDPISSVPPLGLESTPAAIQMAPPISTFDSIWDTIKQDSSGLVSGVEQAGKNVFGGVVDVTKTVYGTAKEGVSTVVSDIATPIEGVFKGAYTYIILAVVVLGGVIYFAGKSGALRIGK